MSSGWAPEDTVGTGSCKPAATQSRRLVHVHERPPAGKAEMEAVPEAGRRAG